VLLQLIEKARSLSLDELYSIVETLMPMVVTDMTNAEIISCVLEYAPLLQSIEVISQRVPAEGTYTHAGISGMRVLVPDLEANHQFLIDTIGLKED